jgi:glucosyl-dolichyl phosphate glucuronosyltransferase
MSWEEIVQAKVPGTTCCVSVIICTYNRAESLQRALVSLSAMVVPEDISWEVLVVDNNSKDRTEAVTLTFARGTSIRISYVFERRQGLNYARNAGVNAARGDILCFIDDDVQVTPNWLEEIINAFNLHPVVGVGGRVIVKEEFQRPTWWNAEYDGALGKFDPGETVILSDDNYTSIIGIGANLAFKRAVFDKYGGFRRNLDRQKTKLLMGGDVEFALRIKKAGELTMFYPYAVVYHCPDPSRFKKSYLRRWYFRIGEWEARKFVLMGSGPLSLLNVPRWKYRQVLEQLLRTFARSLTGRRNEAFYHELRFLSLLGYFFGATKNTVMSRVVRASTVTPCIP